MTKTELLNIPNEAKALEKLEEKLNKMRARLYSPKSAEITEVKSTGGKCDQLAEKVIDLENEIAARRAELQKKKETAGRIFNHLDSDHRYIMQLYYVTGLTWPEVADALAISPASIYRKRSEALLILASRAKKKTAAEPAGRI